MADVVPDVTIEVLQEFADAWNRHDVEALMSFMAEDCVFESFSRRQHRSRELLP